MRNNKVADTISVYADLVRYKLSLAVTFSSVTGYFIFHDIIEIDLLFLIFGVFSLAAGSAAMNQCTEKKFDAMMSRTMNRPLPQNKISHRIALVVAGCLWGLGMIFLSFTGLAPLLLGMFNVVLYNLVYTRLKRVTPAAIIPGALVGTIPPCIGFVAAGGTVPGTAIVLFSIFMFLWQLPHFALILLKYREDYENAGFVTFLHFLNAKQIRILVFLWVLLSTILLLSFSISGTIFNRQICAVIIPVNVIFIFAFHFLLFRKARKEEIRGPFILVNSFGLLIMILFIINSFL